MNKKVSLKNFEIISAVFSMILGTLLHFVFEWSNNNPIIGIFSAVNESTWEHLKILFIPMLITTIIGYFLYKDIPNYLCSKTKGILISLAFIIAFFYTYTGVLGKGISLLNIISFYVAFIIGEIYTYKKIKSEKSCNNLMAIVLLLIITISFIIFTFKPIHIGLFKDPIDKSYGIKSIKNNF